MSWRRCDALSQGYANVAKFYPTGRRRTTMFLRPWDCLLQPDGRHVAGEWRVGCRVVDGCNDLSGYPGQGGVLFMAQARLFLTSTRILFLSEPSLPHLKTLDVPLSFLTDMKVTKRWWLFSALAGGGDMVEATVLPFAHLQNAALLQISFLTVGASEFHSMCLHFISSMPRGWGWLSWLGSIDQATSMPPSNANQVAESLPLYKLEDAEHAPPSYERWCLCRVLFSLCKCSIFH